jgi:hypothetical protein
VIDVSNPAAPVELGFLDTPDRAQDVKVIGQLAFVADWQRGLRVINVLNPTALVEPGAIGTFTASNVAVIDGLVYVADQQRGLLVIDFGPEYVPFLTDTDGDTVPDPIDNCLTVPNVSQTDCDSDGCGNVCDGDFDQNGVVAIGDFSSFALAYGTGSCLHDIGLPDPPQPDGIVAVADFTQFASLFGKAPGPSGTTGGTTACP